MFKKCYSDGAEWQKLLLGVTVVPSHMENVRGNVENVIMLHNPL